MPSSGKHKTKTKPWIKNMRHPSLHTYLSNTHTSFQTDKCYNKWDIHVQMIYMKNKDFRISDTFAQTSLKLFEYYSYQYIGLIMGYLMICFTLYSPWKRFIYTLWKRAPKFMPQPLVSILNIEEINVVSRLMIGYSDHLWKDISAASLKLNYLQISSNSFCLCANILIFCHWFQRLRIEPTLVICLYLSLYANVKIHRLRA